MKEFTKSVASSGLAGLLFGARQVTNIATQPPRNGDSDRATEAFNAVAQAAADQCGDSLRETYHALDRIQRSAIDTGFRFASFDAFNSHGANESLSGFAQQTTEQFRRWFGDCKSCGDEEMRTPPGSRAFTLVELLVVIAIVGILVGILLPAVQQARETSRNMQCKNNMRQLGLALHLYESAHRKFPSSGQGLTDSKPYQPRFDRHSTFLHLLPFIEQSNIADKFDYRFAYNEITVNQAITKNVVNLFICPSPNVRPRNTDSQGYGAIDYGATLHTNIDPITGLPDGNALALGALSFNPPKVSEISDGTASTIALGEDVGRHDGMKSLYDDPIVPGQKRSHWRWADPDNAFGVSFTPNFHRNPWGGPANCRWIEMNCGPNDELFSFHPGGANTVFCDGHVHFLTDHVDIKVLRALVTRSEGETIGEF